MAKKEKKEINKKELRNIVLAGVTGGTLGGLKETGKTINSSRRDYSQLKKMFINQELSKYLSQGISKKDAIDKLKKEFSNKTIPLAKVIQGYDGPQTARVGNAYITRAVHELPYKAIGGAIVGFPAGVLAYSTLSSLAENKKNGKNLKYLDPVQNNINKRR